MICIEQLYYYTPYGDKTGIPSCYGFTKAVMVLKWDREGRYTCLGAGAGE